MQPQNITRASILVLLATSAFAATVQPELVLSNFQSTVDMSQAPSSQFGGFTFDASRVWWSSPLVAWLRLGDVSSIESGGTAQVFAATATVDFDVPGYWVTSISMAGRATTDGGTVRVAAGTSLPCGAFITGPDSEVRGCSEIPPQTSSGTITAYLSMGSDALQKHFPPGGGFYYNANTGTVGMPTVVLWLEPVHAPEPATFGTLGAALALLIVWRRR